MRSSHLQGDWMANHLPPEFYDVGITCRLPFGDNQVNKGV